MSAQVDNRRPERVLNIGPGPPEDGMARRSDLCPKCGAERWELLVAPDRFFCDGCQIASLGPNKDVDEPEPEQIDLFAETDTRVIPIQAGSPIAKRAAAVLENAVSTFGEGTPPSDEA